MTKKEETPEEKRAREMVEEIASNIAQLSRSVRQILGGRIKEETIIILIAHTTKLPQYNVKQVLDALKNMEHTHLK